MLVCRAERAKTGTRGPPGLALTSVAEASAPPHIRRKPNFTKTLEAKLRPAFLLVIPKFFYRLSHISHLRKNGIFQLWGVSDEGIQRSHATHGCIEVFEEFI